MPHVSITFFPEFGSAHETEKIVRLAQDFEPNHVRGAFLGLHGSRKES
jgi:hypothetical protein